MAKALFSSSGYSDNLKSIYPVVSLLMLKTYQLQVTATKLITTHLSFVRSFSIVSSISLFPLPLSPVCMKRIFN